MASKDELIHEIARLDEQRCKLIRWKMRVLELAKLAEHALENGRTHVVREYLDLIQDPNMHH